MTVRFHFDLISPYAYIGWRRLRAAAKQENLDIEPVPVLFAALLEHHGHKGPVEIPPKRLYTFKHIVRLAHDLGIELRPPVVHPFNPLLGLRLCTLPLPPSKRVRMVETLFDFVWAGQGDVTDPAAVERELDRVGFDGMSMVEAAGKPEAKQALRELTDQAIAAGVFGVPTFDVDGELFWGQDSLPHVLRYLAGEDPVDEATQEAWTGTRWGATRRSGPGG